LNRKSKKKKQESILISMFLKKKIANKFINLFWVFFLGCVVHSAVALLILLFYPLLARFVD